jgi:hypothetical protein
MIPAKYAIAGVGIVLVATSAAQIAPVPVDAGPTLNPVVITLGIIAAGAVGFYIWHRKHPQQADAALTEAHKDLSAVARSTNELLAELVSTIAEHAKTIQEQAKIIASPPVQAVINAQATETAKQALIQMGASPAAAAKATVVPIAPLSGPQVDSDTLAAARAYRVAYGLYGASDPRTVPYLSKLASYPDWSNALVFAGAAGYDAAAEQAIAGRMNHG